VACWPALSFGAGVVPDGVALGVVGLALVEQLVRAVSASAQTKTAGRGLRMALNVGRTGDGPGSTPRLAPNLIRRQNWVPCPQP
jgi:hypothetical protein